MFFSSTSCTFRKSQRSVSYCAAFTRYIKPIMIILLRSNTMYKYRSLSFCLPRDTDTSIVFSSASANCTSFVSIFLPVVFLDNLCVCVRRVTLDSFSSTPTRLSSRSGWIYLTLVSDDRATFPAYPLPCCGLTSYAVPML